MNYRRKRNLGTVIPFPFNVPMPYQVDPVSGKLVQAPSLFKLPGQNAGAGGTNCSGCCDGNCTCGRSVQFPRLRRFGLQGLGDDGFDGGDGGDGFDSGSSPDQGPGSGSFTLPGPGDPGFIPVDTVPPDTTLPPIDQISTGFSTNSDGSVTDTSSGTTYFTDGSSQTSDGTMYFADGSYVTPDDVVHYPDGSTYFPDGSYVDAVGNLHPPGSVAVPPSQAAQAGRGGGSSGGGGGGGVPKPSAGQQPTPQQPTPLQRILCTLNPNQAACQRGAQQPAAASVRPAAKAATSSVSTWFSQNWPWLATVGAVVLVLPNLLPSGRR